MTARGAWGTSRTRCHHARPSLGCPRSASVLMGISLGDRGPAVATRRFRRKPHIDSQVSRPAADKPVCGTTKSFRMTWRAPRTPGMKAGAARRQRSRGRNLLLTIAVLGATASIAGLGTFATFTSSTSASHTVSSGTVVVALGATGASTNRLNVDATAIAPGDTIQRSVDLIDQGMIDLAS